MKVIALLLVILPLGKNLPFEHLYGGHKITLDQAQSILGEKCSVKEEINMSDENGHRFSGIYETVEYETEKKSLFYIFESFKNSSLAEQKFIEFSEGNINNKGFEAIDSGGDQAFYLTDSQNFALLIIRKNNELIRLKVNKISSKTSKVNMIKVGNSIAARM